MKPRPCARAGCGTLIPENRSKSALYCSDRCADRVKNDNRLSREKPMRERLYAILESLAAIGDTVMPRTEDLAKRIGSTNRNANDFLWQLSSDGFLGATGMRGRRVYRLLKGPYAGHALTPTQQCREKPQAPACRWCGKPVKRPNADNAIPSLTCSVACHREYMAHGASASKAQIQARLDHIKRQPKGCVTVEDFIRAGGIVYSEPARPRP